MQIRSFLKSAAQCLALECHVCHKPKFWGCQCGWILAVAAIAVSVAAAGYSAYSSSEQAAQQRRDQQKAAEANAEAETQAGQARRRAMEYQAERQKATMRSREAASGAQIGEGSLLEDEMQFSRDANYAQQMAAYPNMLNANLKTYEGRLFGAMADRINTGLNTGVAAGGTAIQGSLSYLNSRPARSGGDTLATGYGSD